MTEQFLDYIEFMKSQPHRDVDKESEYPAQPAQNIKVTYIRQRSVSDKHIAKKTFQNKHYQNILSVIANIDFFYANEWLDALVKILYYAFFFIYAYGLGISSKTVL